MADQAVRVQNWPDTTSGSPQRVAYDLTMRILGIEAAASKDAPTRESVLDLYAECRRAAFGTR